MTIYWIIFWWASEQCFTYLCIVQDTFFSFHSFSGFFFPSHLSLIHDCLFDYILFFFYSPKDRLGGEREEYCITIPFRFPMFRFSV